MSRRSSKRGVVAWAHEHWFLSFLLVSGAINTLAIVLRGWPQAEPPAPPNPPIAPLLNFDRMGRVRR